MCSKWQGVTCNDAKLIAEVKLPYSNLRGVLPLELAALHPSLAQVGAVCLAYAVSSWRLLQLQQLVAGCKLHRMTVFLQLLMVAAAAA
jgi:hypothetical protein